MERLTKIDGCGQNDLIRCFDCGPEKAGENLENCGYCSEGWQRALNRLAAYEDTGLEPDEADDRVWRDADVELPPDDGQVLIIVSGRPRRNVELVNAYELASYVGGDGWVLESYPEWEKAEVSWWMPLPAAPKEK